jgi:protein-disulfide isomerase
VRPGIRLAIAAAAIGIAAAATTQWRLMRQVNSLERQVAELKTTIATMARPSPRGAAAANPPLPSEPVSLEGAVVRGNRQARLAVVAYSDFQCPYCARFAETTFRELDKGYIATGKVLFAFRHLPLTRIHSQAFDAAAAAACAGRQGKFWEMHDRLFASARQLSDATWRTAAGDLGLNRPMFDRCLDAEGPEAVRQDVELARALEISGTPTFLIGRIEPDGRVKVSSRLAGGQPVGRFKSIIDPLLAN